MRSVVLLDEGGFWLSRWDVSRLEILDFPKCSDLDNITVLNIDYKQELGLSHVS